MIVALIATTFVDAAKRYESEYYEKPRYSSHAELGFILGAAAIGIGIAGLCRWSHNKTIDNTPYETYLHSKSHIIDDYRWLFDDVEYYARGARIAIIVNERFTRAQYPTLEYYATIEKVIKKLEDILYALNRKFQKEYVTTTRLHIQDHIHHTETLISSLTMFKKEIKGSNSYNVEYNAKHPQIKHDYVIKINEPRYVYR